MAIVYVPKSKYKIFRKKPSYAKPSGNLMHYRTFTYTTNNPKRLRGIVAKKGSVIRYD